jgi:hypothetical protein
VEQAARALSPPLDVGDEILPNFPEKSHPLSLSLCLLVSLSAFLGGSLQESLRDSEKNSQKEYLQADNENQETFLVRLTINPK